MKHRVLPLLLVLALILSLSPALAVAESAWTGPLSEDALPTLVDTGRGYIAYYFYASAIYWSPDGVNWTDLSDRSWVQEARNYIGRALGHREFQIIWTGTEYMLRQDLRDDARSAYQTIGDSPRNASVTFLNQEFQVIGELPLDGAVTNIRYEDDTYYATVDGSEVSFTREAWLPKALTTEFSDVPASAWYAQGVALCAEKGIMVGTGEGAFSPNTILTSAESAVLALRLHSLLHGGDGDFEMPPEDWGVMTMTFADGEVVQGLWNDDSIWEWYMLFRTDLGHLCFRLETEERQAWGLTKDYQSATLSMGGAQFTGTLHFTNENHLLLYFDPEDGQDGMHQIWQLFSDAEVPEWGRAAAYYSDQYDLGIRFFNAGDPAGRGSFAYNLAQATGELAPLRQMERIPDVSRDGAPHVYMLYEAGILTGTDLFGTFDGEGTLTRAQAAVMVARVLDESLRVSDPLSPLPTEGYTLTYLMDGSPDCGVSYPVCVLGSSEENEGRSGVLLLDGTLLPWPGNGESTPTWALNPCGDYVYFGVYDETTENPYDTRCGLMDRNGNFIVPMENGRAHSTYAIEGGFFSEIHSADGPIVWTLLDEQGQLVREVPAEDSDPYSLYPPKERQPFRGIHPAVDFTHGDTWGQYYADADGHPVSQRFDWAGNITDDGQGFVGLEGKIYRIEFGK